MTLKSIVGLAVLTLFVAEAPAFAYTSQSKTTFAGSSLCKAKVGAKNIKGAAYKAAWTKCMSDPTGYQ